MDSVVVVGSGSLARNICFSLAVLADRPLTVTVVARDPAKSAEVAAIAAMRAALSGTPAGFRAATADLADTAALAEVLWAAAPDWVLHCASLQSPWEQLTHPSRWTELLSAAGFAATAPLHALLAAQVAAALRDSGVPARLLNACFPDAVNPILAGLGLPITAGVGNVALLAAGLRGALGLKPADHLRVLAHHIHLNRPEAPADEVLAWVGDEPVGDVTAALAALRGSARPELNAVTGHAAALLLLDLARGEVATNLPGPAGLPGGYPVCLAPDGTLGLDLPPGWDRAAAVAWNDRAGRREGIHVGETAVAFGGRTSAALSAVLPEFAGGFAVARLYEVAAAMLEVRENLRRSAA
ncbi:hypothetical protein Cs7R123_15430 [Catellatospora sp. TT07R-123]|uniref:potassium transporter TrkA n=1 Tax=Catellatospora sp. TT07R-123 TaxID=2733863 RepID=UPI001B114466|nr:potassium transporter TrkA [Catellatospora sp. TT07R-123]GHJ44201.1 hypothetical protein Cs7R123_15430 [Catellatospora sp. TT07R-123]